MLPAELLPGPGTVKNLPRHEGIETLLTGRKKVKQLGW